MEEGLSTIINQMTELQKRFVAYSTGNGDQPNLTQAMIDVTESIVKIAQHLLR